jgi:hypothetical protein
MTARVDEITTVCLDFERSSLSAAVKVRGVPRRVAYKWINPPALHIFVLPPAASWCETITLAACEGADTTRSMLPGIGR